MQQLSQKEVKRFVFICRGIAESAIKTYHKRAAEILYTHGWCLYDLSIDCIGELFTTDNEGKLLKFESFLKNFNPSLNHFPDNQVFLILKGYVNRFVSYRLMKLLGEFDPEGRRISRNIREAVRNNRIKLQMTWDFRGEVLNFSEDSLNENLPEFPIIEFEEELLIKINKTGSISEILERIGIILSSQDYYRKSVHFIDVIQIIKRLYKNIFYDEVNNQKESQLNFNGINESELEILRNSTVRFIAEKINSIYYQKHKIEKYEARSLLIIIKLLLDDWLNDSGTDHNYFKYAEKELNCTKEEYNERWSSIVHYLVKIMRLFIKEQFEVM
jgi:hypothetical protein